MKKYVFMRILRSLVSIFLVTTLVYTLIYTLVPRRKIFNQDLNYVKNTKTPDAKTDYENTVFDKMGYIQYYSPKELAEKASKEDSSVTVENTEANKKIYQDYIKKLGNGWTLHQLPESKRFYATREIPIYERVFDFYANLIQIDHPWKIQDANNPDLERYIRVENDPAVGWSLVGSGTKHKYLLYFNSSFPFIHQNFINFDLGNSYPTFQDIPVLQVITQKQGGKDIKETTFPTGVKKESSIDIYSRTYLTPSKADDQAKANFGENDAYTKTISRLQDPSMIGSSAIIGIISVIITYFVGIPLGIFMARFKNTYFDSVSTGVLNFFMAIPTVAAAYILRTFGGAFGLPDLFTARGASDITSYILPALILGFFGIPGMALWMRRFLVDQQSSDYVRFARAKGLSEREISSKHIFKNAMVPLVAGIPGSIIGVIAGATLTESIFAFPGMGKMLIDSIKASNNTMVVGLTFIFTFLSIASLLAGDILMTIVDPRIKLTTKGGK